MNENIYDIIIIGGGPAGITAGIYGARKQLKTLLVSKDFSGQIAKASEVENYPGFEKISGRELMEKLFLQLKSYSVETKETEIKSVKKEGEIFLAETVNGEVFQAKAIIVASGRNPRPLKVLGEENFSGRGVSYCSICDAPLFRGKIVAVIGGGNSGARTVLDLTGYAQMVYWLELGAKLKADEMYQTQVKNSGKTEIFLNTKIIEIRGKTMVEEIVTENLVSKEERVLAVQGVFVEIGYLPATAFLLDLVDFNEAGEIVIDQKTNTTKTAGLFSAGDVTNIKYKQVIVAAAEGAKAALSAYEYLQTISNIKDQNAK